MIIALVFIGLLFLNEYVGCFDNQFLYALFTLLAVFITAFFLMQSLSQSQISNKLYIYEKRFNTLTEKSDKLIKKAKKTVFTPDGYHRINNRISINHSPTFKSFTIYFSSILQQLHKNLNRYIVPDLQKATFNFQEASLYDVSQISIEIEMVSLAFDQYHDLVNNVFHLVKEINDSQIVDEWKKELYMKLTPAIEGYLSFVSIYESQEANQHLEYRNISIDSVNCTGSYKESMINTLFLSYREFLMQVVMDYKLIPELKKR